MTPGNSLRRDFEHRIRPHGPRLLGYARRLLADPEEAPDVLQAALGRAFEAHDRYDPEASFKGWIYRFVTNEALNANRRHTRARAVRPLEDDDAEAVLATELAYDDLLRDPDTVLPDLDGPLAEALAELGPQQRAAFLLRSLADMGCAEIGALLDVPKGTVMSWLFRARVKLRRRLAAYARAVRWPAEVR